ncbi:hypothetical protein LRL17_13550 [Rhodococcus qingshengii]|uniref:hypothetical protein n=1 Tax=Rhodococcus qingshengii TaxID=334542 RepID=UPI001E2F04D9|nr:hypothetical protein [Rhodococcus qingshengii]UGQ54627.1 hypothetical protein LRL17_13550 [Rhodococcus qingshengii]
MSVSSTVFLGTPTEKTSDGFEDTYLFDVSRVYKGDLASVTSVGTLANGNGCGTSYVLGTEQLMFVSAPYDVDAEHVGHRCGPATETGFDIQAAVESVYGAGYAPSAGGTPSVGVSADRSTVIGGGAAVALLAVLGWFGWKRRRAQ